MKGRVRHDREELVTLSVLAVLDRVADLVIGPAANAGVLVLADVRGRDLAERALEHLAGVAAARRVLVVRPPTGQVGAVAAGTGGELEDVLAMLRIASRGRC